MKKILSLLAFALLSISLFAQEEDYPVGYTFESGLLIDNQTIMTPYKGGIEFQIHHRMGYLKDGLGNLYGLYSPSNIRLGLNYGITDNIMLGVGTTKDTKMTDIQLKYAFLKQTESGKMPVSVTYYGNAAIDARDQDTGIFGPDTSFRFIHRVSYFNQLIIARKFSDAISLQVAPTLIYFNSVERGYKNLNYGIHAGGKVTFAMSHSIIFEFDHIFSQPDRDPDGDGEDNFGKTKPQIAIGWEKSTPTHGFQLFFANYKGILGQQNFVYNQNDFAMGVHGYIVGFNVTVRF